MPYSCLQHQTGYVLQDAVCCTVPALFTCVVLIVVACLSATQAYVLLAAAPMRPYPPASIDPLAVLMKQSPNGRPCKPHTPAPRSAVEHTHQFAGHAASASPQLVGVMLRPTRTVPTVHSPADGSVPSTSVIVPAAVSNLVPGLPCPHNFPGASA